MVTRVNEGPSITGECGSILLALSEMHADLRAYFREVLGALGLCVSELQRGARLSRVNLPSYQLILFGWDERVLRAHWLCAGLRQHAKYAGIVAVSATGDESAHLRALRAGADEFLTTRQSAELVTERLRVLLRRVHSLVRPEYGMSASGSVEQTDVATPASPKRYVADLTRVQERIFDVLAAAHSPVSTAELISRAWPGQRVFEHTVHTHISLLRQRLFGSGLRLVNERGRGYLLEREATIRESMPHGADR